MGSTAKALPFAQQFDRGRLHSHAPASVFVLIGQRVAHAARLQ